MRPSAAPVYEKVDQTDADRDQVTYADDDDDDNDLRKSEDALDRDHATLEAEAEEEEQEEAERLLFHSSKRRRQRRRWSCCGFAIVHVVISLAFLGLLFGAWSATRRQKYEDAVQHVGEGEGEGEGEGDIEDDWVVVDEQTPQRYVPQTLSNGTHDFAPTTLLISLDGFRADFLRRNITPSLARLRREGVSPKFMLPSFPSLTFPNHYTLVTGLYPESHGIVGNTFWDPTVEKEFFYTDPARSLQAEWWDGAEPVWATAEKGSVRTGVHMWPGSEVEGKGGEGWVKAEYVDQYNGKEALGNKVGRILGWLDLGMDERPQLIAAYVPNVDADGHLYGPNSTYIRSTIAEVDGMMGELLQGLEERNLSGIVNVVVVSDHGMATTSVRRLIQLEDLIDTGLIEHTDGWPLYGLRPYNDSPERLQALYLSLLKKSQQVEYMGKFEVYLRDTNMPERYHFSKNDRIAPLWLVPTAGWAIVTKDEFDIAAAASTSAAGGEEPVYHPRGLHGYDPEHPLMRAIFVARGPAFPHVPGSAIPVFQNTEVYNIVCDSVGIEPAANNGTLRLPLPTDGVHDFVGLEGEEMPYDPQDDESLALPYVSPSIADMPDVEGGTATVANDGEAMETRPVVHDGLDEGEKGAIDRWFEWVSGRLDAIRGWAAGMVGGSDGNNDGGGPQ
ncbi:hypothetical protein BAUCODRAFT_113907 [Baudoinia panamericana UAMH 10762]|uniref:Uncharacterized protein n=1 Tax=Baudoinia panamericana (strain UAMH 10762) TaxID=717646 RepID=M2N4A2_BAUPA|nr:uncharacterized protein BAUCODRAFT_113907 [Baudoinia panamericana UAMH 10762]EMC93510.1 hypothetical protein BAUCODRAFT_113907 [Baudoinia panamericana UAMH 10762]